MITSVCRYLCSMCVYVCVYVCVCVRRCSVCVVCACACAFFLVRVHVFHWVSLFVKLLLMFLEVFRGPEPLVVAVAGVAPVHQRRRPVGARAHGPVSAPNDEHRRQRSLLDRVSAGTNNICFLNTNRCIPLSLSISLSLSLSDTHNTTHTTQHK